MAIRTSDDQLQRAVDAYYAEGGNKAAAARSIGLKRQTYIDQLKVAEARFGIRLGKVVSGKIDQATIKARKLPRKGHIKRYLVTSAQNNTHVHPGFNNLLALRDYYDELPNGSCELLVSTFTYDVSSYGHKNVKRGRYNSATEGDLWYAPELVEHIADDNIQLAPGLVLAGKQNILPTNVDPLARMESFNGRQSNIVPHTKMHMESVASMADEATKFNYSTGAVTMRNYIQKRAGILAEQRHDYGALLVEVDSLGNWWVFQIHIADDDSIQHLGPDGVAGLHVQAGQVEERPVTAAINWGDAHAAEMEMWVRELAWGEGGMLDTLQAKHQFMNDLFSMRSRGHHEMRDFHRMYEKHVTEEEPVEGELQLTAEFLESACRTWCKTVVVPSNHDRHLDRWLNEADFRLDLLNAKLFCFLQYHVLDAMDRGDKDFNVLEFALNRYADVEAVHFMGLDESYLVAGVENGLHGDLGANGSRGTTRSLTRLGRPVNKGHDHTAAIRDLVYSAGACSLSFPYMKGPNSHSISHIVTYENGTRTIVTMWAGGWRAS